MKQQDKQDAQDQVLKTAHALPIYEQEVIAKQGEQKVLDSMSPLGRFREKIHDFNFKIGLTKNFHSKNFEKATIKLRDELIEQEKKKPEKVEINSPYKEVVKSSMSFGDRVKDMIHNVK